MKWLLALDPGDLHTGWARWTERGLSAGEVDSRWASTFVAGMLVDATIEWGEDECEVVCEKFELGWGNNAEVAVEQLGSEMTTSQLIGVVHHLCLQAGVHYVEQRPYAQGKAMRAQMKARGYKWTGRGNHAHSAELHLWYRLIREHGVRP